MSQLETSDRSQIEAHQLARLQEGLKRILPHNGFYRQKLLRDGETISIERLADLPVDVEIASEFRYRQPALSQGSLAIAMCAERSYAVAAAG